MLSDRTIEMPRITMPRSVKLWLESFNQTPRDKQPVVDTTTNVWRADMNVHTTMDSDVVESARTKGLVFADREYEVLLLLVEGRSSAEIAEQLFISRRTAEIHVAGILAKLGVNAQAAAVLITILSGDEGTWREDMSVRVRVPWLPMVDANFLVSGHSITLRDIGGSEVKLSILDFQGRSGKLLRFQSRGGGVFPDCIEFAGMGRDAEIDVECLDETIAEEVAHRIENPFAERLQSRQE
jgi:DNA-binding CsgD family transcriptional regulator